MGLKIVLRYVLGMSGIGLLFSNFIACGAKMYKVSLDDDVSAQNRTNAAPIPAEPGIHAPDGWRDLPIVFRTDPNITEAQRVGLALAMQTWETAVGRKLFDFQGQHTKVTGDTFPDLYSSLKDSVNGHYLDKNWDKTGKSKFVLATTIWDNDPADPAAIKTADIRYNDSKYLFGDSLLLAAVDAKEVVDMQSLALHELGHLLGLAHMEEAVDAYSIMNPALFIGEGLTSRMVSEGDIRRIQKIYGCLGASCDVTKVLATIEKQQPKLAAGATEKPAPTPSH